jgi:hypothetical protein
MHCGAVEAAKQITAEYQPLISRNVLSCPSGSTKHVSISALEQGIEAKRRLPWQV